jgi:hypothetical protein
MIIEISIQLDTITGELKQGCTPDIPLYTILGMIDIAKSLIMTPNIKPKEPSRIVTPHLSLKN